MKIFMDKIERRRGAGHQTSGKIKRRRGGGRRPICKAEKALDRRGLLYVSWSILEGLSAEERNEVYRQFAKRRRTAMRF